MTVPVSNIHLTFSNTQIDYTAFGMNVSNINCNSEASLMKLKVNGNAVFRIDMDGNFGYQREIIWIPARSMLPSLSNAAYYTFGETPTSKILKSSLVFSATDDQSAQFDILMPKTWNKSQIRYRVVSSPASNSSSSSHATLWRVQSIALSDLDSIYDPIMTSNCYVSVVGNNRNNLYVTNESPLVTVDGNPQDNDLVVFKVTRESSNAGDTLTTSSRLFGIQVILNPNNNN